MIKKRIFLFFACFFCFQVWAEDNSKIVGHLGEEANQKPIHLEHINLGLYLNAGRYLQVGQEPWIQSLMEVITYRLMDIEAVSRGVEYPESDLENFLFGSPMNAKLYSYYSEIFDAKIVREYFRIQRLAMMMQEVMAYELVEAYDKIPSEEELLNFYIENQKAAFTRPSMYRLAMIELDDSSEAELVESKLLE